MGSCFHCNNVKSNFFFSFFFFWYWFYAISSLCFVVLMDLLYKTIVFWFVHSFSVVVGFLQTGCLWALTLRILRISCCSRCWGKLFECFVTTLSSYFSSEVFIIIAQQCSSGNLYQTIASAMPANTMHLFELLIFSCPFCCFVFVWVEKVFPGELSFVLWKEALPSELLTMGFVITIHLIFRMVYRL